MDFETFERSKEFGRLWKLAMDGSVTYALRLAYEAGAKSKSPKKLSTSEYKLKVKYRQSVV